MTEIEKTLQFEGGYVDDPNDAGGETNFGISKRQYPHLDIKNLTREQASEIYQRDYMNKYGFNQIIPKSIRWKVFDMSVNMGSVKAVVILQLSLGLVPDGVFGEKTKSAANQATTAIVLANLCQIQGAYYQGICARNPSQGKFLTGWMRRAQDDGIGLS
jgi:lysozyme family protein